MFGLDKVHQVHLEVAAKEYEKMQQVVSKMPFFGGPGKAPDKAPPKGPDKAPEKPAEEPDIHKGNGFGTEFPWAHADVIVDGETLKNVGLRYKGNASYMASARAVKRNFKIGLEHDEEELRYHGMKTLNLNAGALDPTRAREALAYSVFRAAGIAAPRTAFAEVTLTVPGKYDKEYLGLYTMIEQVDKTFLKQHFKSGKGVLMKPERLRGIDYLGEDWERYKDRYLPKDEPTADEAKRVIDFARLINKGGDEQFAKEISSYLDIDQFLRFLAVNAFLSNLDSFIGLGHNYYIYLNPTNNKFVFIPWDLDLSLAAFPMGGSADQQADLSLAHPHMGQHKLIDRVLALKEPQEKYQQLLKDLAAACFTKDKLLKDLDTIEKVTKELLPKEKKAVEARKETAGGFGPLGGGMFGRTMDLRTFLQKRTDSVEAQLAGRSKGYTPAAFGMPGGGPGGPGRFGIGNLVAKPLLEALDADKDANVSREELTAGAKKFFADADKDKTGKLDEKQLAEGLNRIIPRPPGFGAPPGGGAPPPGTGRTAGALAGAILKRADAKDGKVTLDQFVTAAEALFKEHDKDKTGKLNEGALAAGINALMPPPNFGPPGSQPGGPRPPEPKRDAPPEEKQP
ncbi:MAG: CotH kinase family protein [Planctomycetia bacterium]|nr:CotH kinase family protein [Planctomycetia bacterium]